MAKKEVKKINLNEIKDWILKKHYAKRKPRMQYKFGLFINGILIGVVAYGYPATPMVSRGICGEEFENNVLELNRLVINENSPKNSASFLVANSIKQLPEKYKIIVSYADTSMDHKGYVYQATNFIYTGLTIPMKEWRLKDQDLHAQNVCKKISLKERQQDPNYYQIQRPQKHRYFLFRGNKKRKRGIIEKIEI